MYLIIREIYHARCIFFLDLNKSRISGNMKMKKGSTKFLSHLKILQRGFSSRAQRIGLEERIESEFYFPPPWHPLVLETNGRGREREREPVLPYSRGFHLEVNVMVRWSLRATRTIPQPEPRGMSVSGPRSARGDNETSSQSRVGPPQCFETILIAPFTILDRRSETKTPPRFC